MNIDQASLYSIWQILAYQIVHKTSLWLIIVFFVTAGVLWRLAVILEKHNDREKEARLARKTAIGYAVLTSALWLFSFIMQ